MSKKRGFPQPTRRPRAWIPVIVAVFVLVLIRFLGIYAIQSAYAFYDRANASTQGIVEYSYEDRSGYYNGSTYIDTTTCTTTVLFTPPGQSTSFTITDDQCGTLAKGTQVEVLYDPHDPSIAKTTRQASADVGFAISGTIFWSIMVLILVISLIKDIYQKNQKNRNIP